MRKFFTFLGNFFSFILAIAFVATTVFVIYAFSLDQRLFDANTYKRALERQNVYDRMPRVLAEQMVYTMNNDPCAENPLLCDGQTDQLNQCYEQALGTERYETLDVGMDRFTPQDLGKIQSCFKLQYGDFPPPLVNAINSTSVVADASPDVQGCIVQKLGDQAANEVSTHERPASIEEVGAIATCFSGIGRDVYLDSRPVAFIRNLKVQDWETVVRAVMPPADMRAYAESAIDQTFAYLEGEQQYVTLDLRTLKQRIGGRPGQQAMQSLIDSQAACTDQTYQLMLDSMTATTGNFALCKPGESGMRNITPYVNNHLRTAAGHIPAEMVLAEPIDINADAPFNDGPLSMLAGVSMTRVVLRFTTFVPLILLFIITLFSVRTLKGWLRWWGLPLLAAGLITLTLRIVFGIASEQNFVNALLPQSTLLVSGMVELLKDIILAMVRSVDLTVTLLSIGVTIAGLAMFIGSYYVRPEMEDEVIVVPAGYDEPEE
jgi:hypothetical protein